MEGTPVKRNESEEMYKLLQRKEGAYQLLEEVYKLLEGTPVKHRNESASQLLEEVLQRKESAYQLLEERYKLLEDTPVKNRVESATQLLEEVYKLLEGTPVEHLKESAYQLLGKLDEVEHRKESAYQLLNEAYQLLEEAYQLLLEAYQLLEEVYKLLEGTPVEHLKESGSQLIHPKESGSQVLHPKESASQLLAALLLEKRLETLWKAKEPKIQKVRDLMNFEKYYKPILLSLGPIHHGKEKYQLGEKYKRVWACYFIDGCRKTMDNLYKKIEEKIEELRDCYEDEVTENYDDEDLAWMLFVDGCAILQFIYCAINKGNSKLGIINNSVDFVHRDLFLLENQLPYRLLKLLMSDNEKELRDSIKTYIQMQVMVPEGNPKEQRILRDEEPIHLLDLLRTALLGNPHEDSVIIRNRERDQHQISGRNVQELKAAGIHLRRSSNSCLRDISFSQSLNLLGHLYIPPITLNNLTRPMFLNLVAYEKCDNFKNDFGVTSYIAFLRSLIKEAKDVRELRKAGIFYNLVGSDEEVAKLFNEMPFIPTNIGVEEKIEEYYGTMLSLMFRIYHDNFNSTSRRIFKLLVLLLGLSGIKYTTRMYPFIYAHFLALNILALILTKGFLVWLEKLLDSFGVQDQGNLLASSRLQGQIGSSGVQGQKKNLGSSGVQDQQIDSSGVQGQKKILGSSGVQSQQIGSSGVQGQKNFFFSSSGMIGQPADW